MIAFTINLAFTAERLDRPVMGSQITIILSYAGAFIRGRCEWGDQIFGFHDLLTLIYLPIIKGAL
jgi:hypothetical protein